MKALPKKYAQRLDLMIRRAQEREASLQRLYGDPSKGSRRATELHDLRALQEIRWHLVKEGAVQEPTP